MTAAGDRSDAPRGGTAARSGTAREAFVAAARLGLTSFGGPIAHIGYFRREYVVRRGWVDEHAFADLVALCQSLPGPASSQLGIAIGTRRAGPAGGIAAWLGFTLPSALFMTAIALLALRADVAGAGWVHGLKLAAVAVVAQAVWSMARTLTPDAPRRAMAVAAAAVALVAPAAFVQVAIIGAGAAVGALLLDAPAGVVAGPEPRPVSRRFGLVAFVAFLLLLGLLPTLAVVTRSPEIAQAEAYYRAGALVFGGGHLVLPLLDATVVAPGWVTESQFLAGYGAAQAVPGPLFTFAAYLGAVASVPPGGVAGAILAVGAIFLPSFLLVWAALAFWDDLRRSERVRRALAGTNAVVVGILAAALWSPLWTGSVATAADVGIVVASVLALVRLRVPPVAVVGLAAVAAQAAAWASGAA